MGQLKPSQVLSKAYRQVSIETEDFNHFKDALRTLLLTVSDGQEKKHKRDI